MNYQMLGKLYYQNKVQYMTELNSRRSSPSAVRLDFNIHDDPAFYLSVPELLTLQSGIYQAYLRFQSIYSRLPHVAQDCYCRKCLVDEVVLTNDLEGVHSTRRDVLNVLQSDKSSEKNARFEGLIKKYVLLIEGADIPLNTLQDVRNLYNDIVLSEIAKEDAPDGTYFRKESVSVITSTDKVKHRGIIGEQQINEHMMQALQLLKDPTHTPLTQTAILHYLIGYIHPFYDGNGRLSRFISSYLLAKVFCPIVAYRLSYTIKQNKKLYYDAFDYVNDRNSGGDLTPFIIIFSELVQQSILSLEEKVTEVSAQLDYYWDMISPIANEDQRRFLFYFVQNALFSPDPFTLAELANISGKSLPTVRKIITSLMDAGLPIHVSKAGHANAYRIDEEQLSAALKKANL